MNILETFFILFETDAKKAEREQEELRKEAGRTADEVDRSVRNAKQLPPAIAEADRNVARLARSFTKVTSLLVAAAGAFAVGRLARGLNDAVDEADRLIDASARIRLSAQDFDTWRMAVKASGGELADAETALASYDEMLRRIQAGIGKRGVEALAGLGLTAENADGSLKDVRTSLLEVAGQLETMDRDAALRAIRRLGITDEGTIKLLLQGRSAIEALTAEQLRNGAITNEQATRIDRYRESSEKLQAVIQGWKFALASAAAPALTRFNTLLIEGARDLGLNEEAVKAVAGAVMGFGAVFGAIGTLATIVAGFGAGAVAVFTGVVAAVLAVGVAVALIYDDIRAFLNGQKSLLGDLMERYPAFARVVDGLVDVFRAAAPVVLGVLGAIIRAGAKTFNGLASFVRGFYAVAAPIFSLFRDVAVAVWGAISRAVMDRIRPWLPLIRFVFSVMMTGVRVVGQVFDAVFGMVGRAWDRLFSNLVRGINALVNGFRTLTGLGGVSENARLAARGVGVGQRQLAFAGRAPLSSATPNSVTSGGARRGGDRNFSIGAVNVSTQATDAAGMAAGARDALSGQFRDAQDFFDDGVER